MPLRFLDLPEPQYVPSYNRLQPELLSQVHQNVQEQGQQSLQYQRDLIGAVEEQTLENIGTLPAELQSEVQNRFSQSRSNIDAARQKYGLRNIMPSIEREARQLSTDLRTPLNLAEQQKSILERIQAAEGPGWGKRYMQENTGFVQDDKGNWNLQAPPVEVLEGWRDLPKEIQTFMQDAEAHRTESGLFPASVRSVDEQGNPIDVSTEFTGQYGERIVEEVLGKDRLKISAVARIINDPQLREQLAMEIASGNAPNIGTDPDGSTTVTYTDPRTGNPKTEAMSNIQALALQKVDPFAEVFSYTRQSYEDTQINRMFDAKMNNAMPSSIPIVVGLPSMDLDSPDKVSEKLSTMDGAIEEAETRLAELDPYDQPHIYRQKEDRLNGLKAERDQVMRMQDRALRKADIDLSTIEDQVSYKLNQLREDLRNAPSVERMVAGLAPDVGTMALREKVNSLNTLLESGIINDSSLEEIKEFLSPEQVDDYKSALESLSSASAAPTNVISVTSGSIIDWMNRTGEGFLLNRNADGEIDPLQEMWWIHSDPEKASSVSEDPDKLENASSMEFQGVMIHPVRGRLEAVYSALDDDGKSLGTISTRAPDGFLNNLSPQNQHSFETYMSSGLDAVMSSPSKEGNIYIPRNGNHPAIGDVFIRSQVNFGEDGQVRDDTFGNQFNIGLKDTSGSTKYIGAETKGDALDILQLLFDRDFTTLKARYNVNINANSN